MNYQENNPILILRLSSTEATVFQNYSLLSEMDSIE